MFFILVNIVWKELVQTGPDRLEKMTDVQNSASPDDWYPDGQISRVGPFSLSLSISLSFCAYACVLRLRLTWTELVFFVFF